MKAFLQAVELWTPNQGALAWHSGAYGSADAFRAASVDTRFRLGEGLPGSVWSSGKPQVWERLEGTDFVRYDAAKAAGLYAGVGIPIYPGGRDAHAVLTLLCAGGADEVTGCIERWDADRSLNELRHAGGYYGALEGLRRSRQRMHFRAGMGLPGRCLESRGPVILDTREPDASPNVDLMEQNGIEVALGIPVFRHGKVAHVMVLMSTTHTPLARAFEIWQPSVGNTLALTKAFYSEGLTEFGEQSASLRIPMGQGLPGRALSTELPQVFDSLSGSRFMRHEAAQQADLSVGVAIPVHDGEAVTSVVVLLS